MLLIPIPLVFVLLTAASLLFVHKKSFSFLFQYFFVIIFYVLNIFSRSIKQTYGQLRASQGSFMKAAHHVLYKKKHTPTNVRWTLAVFLQGAAGVDLEVKCVR